ncbi:MAG: hypothetical protein AB1324_02320 [Candidatus Micrarchaeota archaeon]
MAGSNVSPMTPIERRHLQQEEHVPKPRAMPQFQPPQQQSQEVTLGQRIDNAVQAVKNFFSFSDSLRATAREPERR